MKIIQINAVYKFGSTGRTCLEIEEKLSESGDEVYTAYGSGNHTSASTYKISNKFDLKIHGIMSRIFGLQGYFSHYSTYRFLKYVKKLKPDLVHLRNLHGNYINIPMLLKFLGEYDIPTVITLHDCFFYTGRCTHYVGNDCEKWKTGCYDCPRLKFDNKSWFFDRSSKGWKDRKKLFSNIKNLAVIGVSDWTTEHAKQSILGNAKIIKRIYNWIDLDIFKPHDTLKLRGELGLSDEFVIFAAAQIWSENKGLKIISEIADKLPEDCKVVVAGNIPETMDISDKILAVGSIDEVHVLSDYYAMANVFITPSLYETFGKTTAEALSCGTPVVSYNSMSASELIGVDEKCGFVLSENNPDEYVKKIEFIRKTGKTAYKDNCRAKALSMFDMETNIGQYYDVYERLVKFRNNI